MPPERSEIVRIFNEARAKRVSQKNIVGLVVDVAIMNKAISQDSSRVFSSSSGSLAHLAENGTDLVLAIIVRGIMLDQ